MRKRCKDDDDDDEEVNKEFVDFEDSGDEYEPEESSSESENDDTDVVNNSCSSEDESQSIKQNVKMIPKLPPGGRKTRFSLRQQQDFVFESDKYFGHTNRKVRTERCSHRV